MEQTVPEQSAFGDAIATLQFDRMITHIAGYCVSEYGKERIGSLLPSAVFALVRDELARVDEMRALLDGDDGPPLERLEDTRSALHRAAKEGSVIAAEDFRYLLHTLTVSRKIKTFLSKRSDRSPLLAKLAAELHEDKMLEFHIDRVVDDEGGVKDSASKELRAIRREIIEKSGQLRRRMEGILKRVSDDDMVMEELVTMRDGRMVLPVKVEYKRQIQGFIHSTSATGQTVYIEPTETLDLNNEIRDLQFAEIREVNNILTELTGRLRGTVAALQRSIELLGDIDSLYARARYGKESMGASPNVKLDGPLVLKHTRHPLLLLHKKSPDVVPLDLTLGEDASTIIITGPNAGGKSITMKTAGLCALMVQSGIPVPCDESSEFPMYESIFVDIGDEQSVENDLSTFSSHVSRLAHIIDHASDRSLVLIDEIGTGTDPAEGSALGASILQRLTAVSAHVIATTHHGMLKAFAHEQERMMNAAMEFDLKTLQPTYVFRPGLPGSSYAFEITRRHGMDTRIIDRAREIIGTQSDALEQLLAEVERQSQDLGIRLRKTEQSEEKYEALVTEYTAKVKGLKQEAKQMKRGALEQAEKLLAEANASVEDAIREIREEQASKEAIRTARERVTSKRVEIEKALEDTRPEAAVPEGIDNAEIHSGDEVAMRDNPTTKGIAIEEPHDGKVTVAFGSMKMKLDLGSLRKIGRKEARKLVATQHLEEPIDSNSIDVRGMYGDEAISEIDRFLSDAWSSGMSMVEIIHGKGTGALRKRVHSYLKDLSFVQSFALGEWNEGGSGMTKVLFRES
ncbi:MAG: endonuclease MutS2 [Ignavibacteria bacterium]|nr:MAG: endonuclease MutS2 [Ignavibacteria bacterium]